MHVGKGILSHFGLNDQRWKVQQSTTLHQNLPPCYIQQQFFICFMHWQFVKIRC